MTQEVTEADLPYLRRCVDLAAEAVAAGDFPFGSMLVAEDGGVLAEDRNREVTNGRHEDSGWFCAPGRAEPSAVPVSRRRLPGMPVLCRGWLGPARHPDTSISVARQGDQVRGGDRVL